MSPIGKTYVIIRKETEIMALQEIMLLIYFFSQLSLN